MEVDELFNVVQFFKDDSYEYVRENVTPEEAVNAARHYCTSIGARLGTTVRVIITDSLDMVNFEWKWTEGIVYPPEANALGQLKFGLVNQNGKLE